MDAGTRALQLRFLCEGAKGTPTGLRRSATDEWGNPHPDGSLRIQVVDTGPADPSTENVRSLEPDRDDPDTEED